MMIAAFGLFGCREMWVRLLAALLLLFTSYFYLVRFEDIYGWLLGGGSGILAAGLDLLPGRLNGLEENTAG